MSYKGQQDQKKANASAQTQNADLQNQQNQAAWGNYLMQRGIAPTSPVEPGVLPTPGQSQVVNTRMPLWMTLNSNATTPKTGNLTGVVPRTTPKT